MTTPNWTRLNAAGRHELLALGQAFRDPRKAQRDLLASTLARETGSRFGMEHGFASIDGIEAFRARVPVRDYAAYQPWIDSIADGAPDALTASPPLCFEQTGGSGGGRKLIPYTAPGLAAFRRSVLAWIADLLEHDPAIADGRAYFAISPATRSERLVRGGLPVGLPSDAAYFGEDLAGDAATIMTGGAALAGLADFGTWQEATLAWLCASADLTLVSVWSPTFLTVLIEALECDPEPVLRALAEGRHGLAPAPGRQTVLTESLASGRLDTRRLWPRLRLISAWADGGSTRFAADLAARFPGVPFQPKGLLATEGVFTLPLLGVPFPVPALTSAFLEFEDEAGRLHLVDELEEGGAYQLIATTPGGLYRYRIGDRLRCEGFTGAGTDGASVPMLSFLGRAGNISDLVGEKLEDAFVAACLGECCTGFAALAPCDDDRPHYLLLTDADADAGADGAQALDVALMRNPLYADARRIGQLGTVRTVALDDPLRAYSAWRMARGDRLGDIKPPVLFRDTAQVRAIWPDLPC